MSFNPFFGGSQGQPVANEPPKNFRRLCAFSMTDRRNNTVVAVFVFALLLKMSVVEIYSRPLTYGHTLFFPCSVEVMLDWRRLSVVMFGSHNWPAVNPWLSRNLYLTLMEFNTGSSVVHCSKLAYSGFSLFLFFKIGGKNFK